MPRTSVTSNPPSTPPTIAATSSGRLEATFVVVPCAVKVGAEDVELVVTMLIVGCGRDDSDEAMSDDVAKGVVVVSAVKVD